MVRARLTSAATRPRGGAAVAANRVAACALRAAARPAQLRSRSFQLRRAPALSETRRTHVRPSCGRKRARGAPRGFVSATGTQTERGDFDQTPINSIDRDSFNRWSLLTKQFSVMSFIAADLRGPFRTEDIDDVNRSIYKLSSGTFMTVNCNILLALLIFCLMYEKNCRRKIREI